jgi:hypothetical protein
MFGASEYVEMENQNAGNLRIDLDDGVVVTWYSSTRTLQFQGPREAVWTFRRRFLDLAGTLVVRHQR